MTTSLVKNCRLVAAVAVLSLGAMTRAWAQPAAEGPGAAPRVRLIYDEQSIQDLSRARVYDLILQSVDRREWPTLTTKEPTRVPDLINQYYDIYTRGAGAAPASQRLLADAIVEANDELLVNRASGELRPGEVKLPPVPVRAYSVYNREVAERAFDPSTMTYELFSETGARIARVGDAIPPVSENATARRGKLTSIALSLTDAVMDRLRQSGRALRALLAVDDNGGVANMNLLATEPAQECTPARSWLDGSPYRASIKEVFNAARVDKLEAAAKNLPLTIIDWNIQDAKGVALDPRGHGAKVRAVVSEVLHNLGLQQLDRDGYVRTVELNPMRNRHGLRAMLAAYKKEMIAQSGADIAKEFSGAEHWVDNHMPVDEYALSQRVHSYVLQSIFWNQFRRPQAVNLSFTTDSAALKVAAAHIMIGAPAFGAFAAGNTGMPVSPRLLPQAEAYQWPNLVNVTFGRVDGVIDGDFTNADYKILVSLVAPGCGFNTPPIASADTGSSFASPYVLTAAWIRMLQGVPAAAVKRGLISASQPLAAVGTRVESGGVFDAALFLLRPPSHMLTASRVYLPLSSLTLELSYQVDGVDITIKSPLALQEPAHVVTFQPCPSGNDMCTTVRRWQPDGSVWLTHGPVRAVKFVAVSGQQKIETDSPAALHQLVHLITF